MTAWYNFLFLGHNPINVLMWIFHWILSSRIFVSFYRFYVLPKVLRRVTRKDRVNVVFLPMNVAMWRYGGVYKRMLNDRRFNVVVVTAPRVNQPVDSFVSEQDQMVRYFLNHNVEVLRGFKDGHWIKLRSFDADIIFYTEPFDGIVCAQFEYWSNFKSLFCYAPYSFQLTQAAWSQDNALQNYSWKHYVSLPYQRDVCCRFSRIKGVNAVPVGYFFEEEYQAALSNRDAIEKTWQGDKRKRVIWAPHHSIATGASFKTSAFFEICDDMVRLREKYRDKIVFAFKPHPMLRDNLYQRWGKEKTEAYYADWANADNSFLDDGAFVPLFAGSDAMVHCSGSFIVDYIYTGKPVQYVSCKDRNAPDFGEIGDAALKAHYPAHGIEDIERFIEEVVLGGNDQMKSQRENVYQAYLKSPNGKTFSENVVDDILKGLGKL